MANKYCIYGLNIKSEIKIIGAKEIKVSENDIDVNISYGDIPKKYINIYENKIDLDIDKNTIQNEFCVKINDVGIYFIKDGSEIIVQPLLEGKEEIHSLVIIGTALAIILLQKKKIVMHGSTIVPIKNNEETAIAIVGKSGSGKSSLSTALIEEGNKFVTDDLSAIDIDNGVVKVFPGTYSQKLCIDALNNFGYKKEGLKSVNSKCEKKFYYERLNEFDDSIKRLTHIFILNEDEKINNVHIKEVNGHQKLEVIIENLFYKKVIDYIGIEKELFNKILFVLKNVKVYNLFRPSKKFTVNEQIEKIKKVI
ncbi:MAG: hypothetical protein ACRCVJ_16455 [Clostridium sp.]|uniref:hypothetical protein n=1 Tax=Clostridium sp. TaxID=1506 RepID=UPI003F33113D